MPRARCTESTRPRQIDRNQHDECRRADHDIDRAWRPPVDPIHERPVNQKERGQRYRTANQRGSHDALVVCRPIQRRLGKALPGLQRTERAQYSEVEEVKEGWTDQGGEIIATP